MQRKTCRRVKVRARSIQRLRGLMGIVATVSAILVFRFLVVGRQIVPVSAIHTKYDLTPGGGEKVLFNMAAEIQHLTHGIVDIVVSRRSTCRNAYCARNVAVALGVDTLDWNKIRIKTIDKAAKHYFVWIYIANDLFPDFASRGTVGIYHCQFPLDLGIIKPLHTKETSDSSVQTLATYDLVYLNSKYTAKWYSRALETEKRSYFGRHGSTPLLPAVSHFPPPLKLNHPVAWKTKERSQQTFGIVLVGRFFDGAQSKHHLDAIAAFKELQKGCLCSVHLYLIGHVKRQHASYADSVAHATRQVVNVTLILNARRKDILDTFSRAHVIWSITGIGTHEDSDPFDAEHFGIGLVEGMSSGLIPVVANKGGPVEIVEAIPYNLTVRDTNELIQVTKKVLELSTNARSRLSELSVQRAKKLDTFRPMFASIFNVVGIQLNPVDALLWQLTWQKVRTSSHKHGALVHDSSIEQYKKAIVYIETRHDIALRANLLNLLSNVGPGWIIHIWHGDTNEVYIKSTLTGFGSILKFHSLTDFVKEDDMNPRNEGSYQRLFKMKQFWERLGDIEHVLTFQSDAWFANGLFDETWLMTDYIGAPWCVNSNSVYVPIHSRPERDREMLHSTRQLNISVRVGNGGVSIRRLKPLIHVIDEHASHSAVQENEDVFFASSLATEGYRVATVDEASLFSLECLCVDILHHQDVIKEWKRLSRLPFHKVERERIKRFAFALHKPKQIFNELQKFAGSSSSSIRLFVHLFI